VADEADALGLLGDVPLDDGARVVAAHVVDDEDAVHVVRHGGDDRADLRLLVVAGDDDADGLALVHGAPRCGAKPGGGCRLSV
jgi:sirohydrochlorin ferrochelatase